MFSLLHGKKRSTISQTPDHKAPNHTASAQPHQSIPNSALASGIPTPNISSDAGKPSLAQTMRQRVQALTERASNTGQPNRTGIPDRIKQDFENRSGLSFDDVRVHYNSDKPAKFNAGAFAQGNEIHIAPGEDRSLPHELTHIIQQRYGLVSQTAEIGGVPVNLNSHLEQQADSTSFPTNCVVSHTSHQEVMQFSPPKRARPGQDPLVKKDPDADYVPETTQIECNREQGKAFEDAFAAQLDERGINYKREKSVKLAPSTSGHKQLIKKQAMLHKVDPEHILQYKRRYDFFAPDSQIAYELKSGNACPSARQACFDDLVNLGLPCTDLKNEAIPIKHVDLISQHDWEKG